MALTDLPHPEERSQSASRRTHTVHPIHVDPFKTDAKDPMTMDPRKLWRRIAICGAVLSLSACAIYKPAPGPQPYSYAPGTVYTSPFLNFGVGFLR
jgi:hypothetical protein